MTLKDIAKIAGVSPATVSLVLNNKPGVGSEKRQEILSLLQKHQYGAPKAGLRLEEALPAGHLLFLKVIRNGLIVEENAGFVASILDAIEADCRRSGYLLRMEVCRGALCAALSAIDYARLKGIFVLGTELAREDYALLDQIPIPFIVLDNRVPGSDCSAITMDNAQMVRSAVSHLRSLGFSRIGYLRSSMSIQNFDDRSEAFFLAVRDFGMDCPAGQVFSLEPQMLGAYRDMKALLQAGRVPAPCLFSDNDTIAIGAMKALLEAGYRIPEDVSIIGFDDIRFSAVHSPALSTMRVPTSLIGFLAVRTLTEAMDNPEIRGNKILVQGPLVPRASSVKRL